jgi:site-specific recombinase XerD
MRVRIGIVKGFTAWCVREGVLKRDVCRHLESPRAPQSLPREIEQECVTKILNVVPDLRGQLIVSLMVQEGLRRGEVAKLDVGEIERESRLMLVHGKNSKERWLPITDETWGIMCGYLRDHPATTGPLIRSYTEPHKGLSPNTISVLVAGWMRDAGVKETPFDGRSAHALRHTFAGALLDEGADVRDVQEALGHADLSATYRYLKRRRATGRLKEVMGRRSYRL